jgi:hypothetical protein
MGAGNYYFSAPAGDEWQCMLYVDLEPQSWEDEQETREKAFQEYLTANSHNPPPDDKDLEKIRNTWIEENCGGSTSEHFFYEDQRDCQRESIYSTLAEIFPKVDFDFVGGQPFEDATILGQVGRMVIAQAYTYYHDRLALIVTPEPELQEFIQSVESDRSPFDSGWHKSNYAKLLGVKRSVTSGALSKEMVGVYDRILLGLHENGLAKDISFRKCAWTSGSYVGCDTWAKNEALLVTKQARLAARQKREEKTILKKQALRAELQGGQPHAAWAF